MATITSAATLEKRYNPYTGLSALERSQSGIARAELVYTGGGTWPNAGAGNDRVLSATCSLDTTSSYGYLLTDAFAYFDGGSSNLNMSAIARVQIAFGSLATGDLLYTTMSSKPDRQNNPGNTAIGDIVASSYNSAFDGGYYMTFTLDEPKPTPLIYPYENVGSASQVAFTFGEESQNRPDIDYSLYFRFLQYDVDQSYNYVLNSPQFTR